MDGEEENHCDGGGEEELRQDVLNSLERDRHVLNELLVWNDNASSNLTFNWNEPNSDDECEVSGGGGGGGGGGGDIGCSRPAEGLDATSQEKDSHAGSALETERTTVHAGDSGGMSAEEDSAPCSIEFGDDFVRISDGNALSATITKDMLTQWESFLQSKQLEQQRKESDSEEPSS